MYVTLSNRCSHVRIWVCVNGNLRNWRCLCVSLIETEFVCVSLCLSMFVCVSISGSMSLEESSVSLCLCVFLSLCVGGFSHFLFHGKNTSGSWMKIPVVPEMVSDTSSLYYRLVYYSFTWPNTVKCRLFPIFRVLVRSLVMYCNVQCEWSSYMYCLRCR